MASKKLFALLAVFVAVGGIMATGAFTTVSADRTATVEVAGDDSALLSIDGAAGAPLADPVTESDGVAQINLGASNINGADGLNPNAKTQLSPIVNVTNNGEEGVGVTISVTNVDSGAVDASDVEIISSDGSTNMTGNTYSLDTGQTIQFGLSIDLQNVDQSQLSGNDLDITIQIEADSSEY